MNINDLLTAAWRSAGVGVARAVRLARRYVWALLAVAYPCADQIIASIEAQLPVLQPYMGPNTFRYMGVAIVFVKLGLQAWRGVDQLLTLAARRVEAGRDHD